MVFEDPSYNGSTFNWASDVDALDEELGSLIDSTSTNLTAFKSGGDKLLVMQGWADPYSAATWLTQHLDEVVKITGGERKDWVSLFTVSGKRFFDLISEFGRGMTIHHQAAAIATKLRLTHKFPASRTTWRLWSTGLRVASRRQS
ncbi:hypothetical protein CTRI78_v011235 [Colletotrichum trifolii]|uniref:Carboxylic ester hydrolase n=1 Tax=Colletotrichum trifolii TaxID=5466 RepID=A0A4R8QDL2_COLTR|nr:hypothetical protein CTRI78_v011235 [Colletotrichum trifolii]